MCAQKAMYSEYRMYSKCPLLWKNVYVNKNTVSKQANYRDLVYKKNISEDVFEGIDDVVIKSEAIKSVLIQSGNTFVFEGINYSKVDKQDDYIDLVISDGSVLSLPYPDIYESSFGKYIVYDVITSSCIDGNNLNALVHFQRMALNDRELKIIIRHIQPSSLRMKKPETDEEFEARRAELIKKSKTGVSKAQKQLGETKEEFFERYKKSISINYIREIEEKQYVSSYENILLMKLNCFFRDRSNPNCLSFNECYCKYCEINNKNGCPCIKGISSDCNQHGCIIISNNIGD